MPGGDELRAPFLHADGFDLLRHPQPLEDRQVGRQQRLADVEAGVPGLLDLDHPVAALGQHNRGRGAGGPAADDQYIGVSGAAACRLGLSSQGREFIMARSIKRAVTEA